MLQDILGQLGFDWKVAIANLINFLIIYYLLRNIVFKKISSVIKERQNKIAQGLTDAKLAEDALLKAQSEKLKIVSEAHKEAHDIATKAEADRINLLNEAKEEAIKKAQEIQNQMYKNTEKEKIISQKNLEESYVNLVINGIKTMIKKEINNKESEDFVISLLKTK